MPTVRPYRSRSPIAACLALSLVACGGSRTEPPQGEPEPPPPQTQRPIDTTPAPRPARTEVSVEEVPRMDDRALNAAATAAEHAPPGRDTCESAVNAIVAMLDAAESESPGRERLPRPEREDFLTACRALPGPAQQCLLPTYAMAHQEECNRVLLALPEGKLQAVQAAMETTPNE